MTTWNQRLAEALRESGESDRWLAKQAGISGASMNGWLTGDTKNPGAMHLRKACMALRINMDWVLAGKGQVRLGERPPPTEPGYIKLPHLDVEAAAGHGREVPDFSEVVRWLEVERDWADSVFNKRLPHIHILTARGDSMVGAGIKNGDVLFVDTKVRNYDGDGYYVLSFRGGLQVKRLQANHLTNRLEIVSKPDATESVQIVEPEQEAMLHISGRVAAWWTLKI